VHDTAATHADFDYRYTISVLEGMRRTVNWLDANGKIENSDNDPLYDRVIERWRDLSRSMEQEFAGLDR
jgi:hypothetical protein